MNNILGISGRKGAGKDSICNFIHAMYLQETHVEEDGTSTPLVGWARLNDEGKIIVPTADGESVLDLDSKGEETLEFLEKFVHPNIKKFSLAEPIKVLCNVILGMDWDILNGNDEQKNTLSTMKWSSILGKVPKGVSKEDFMSYRDILKYMGELFRRLDENVWINKALDRITNDAPGLSIIPDVRYENEITGIQGAGGKVIRLLRDPYHDDHFSESSLDNFTGFDAVVDNRELSLSETCNKVFDLLAEWKFVILEPTS